MIRQTVFYGGLPTARRILIVCFILLTTTAAAGCHDLGILIDQRSPAQAQTDQSEVRLRCLRFVLDLKSVKAKDDRRIFTGFFLAPWSKPGA
ncbi:hypothetical protein [Wenzhouxiangella limi]|uniref:Lipoprotein n=1 Tax=Wenzhouxiangella limi TaxID=2707351 RepID=A0A845V0K0_9GAMM|nr:hypothetical protein [Wenzhouxiangella limi]NDY96254.1 hypothetical protein [Wenzhouxiangella limi]